MRSFNFSKNMTHKETTERSDNDMAPKDALLEILEAHAKETNSAMEANKISQPNNEGDEKLGLVPEMPIYTIATMSVRGEKEYLNKLYTVNGEKITWERRGSLSVGGVHGMIDIYDTFLPSGHKYKTIYINMYGAYESTKAPLGFILSDSSILSQLTPAEETVILDKNKYIVDLLYNDFLSVYKQIQEIMNIDQIATSRELLVFTVNYYKSLIFVFNNYYNVDTKTISDFFVEKVKASSGYNLISENFINTNYNDYLYLIEHPCNWVGQACYNYTTKEYLDYCRKNAHVRIILFLVECIFLLKFSGRIFNLDELKSVIVVEHGDVAPTFTKFGTTMNMLIASQSLLNKQIKHIIDVTKENNIVSINNNNLVVSEEAKKVQSNILCNKCGQSLPSDSDFCYMCGSRVIKE